MGSDRFGHDKFIGPSIFIVIEPGRTDTAKLSGRFQDFWERRSERRAA
jgi:hypothetical protein